LSSLTFSTCIHPGTLSRAPLSSRNTTPDRIYGTWELGQDTVASGISDPPAIFCDQPIHNLATDGESMESSDLILAHQARIACHIGGEDGGEPPLNPVLLRTHGTLGAVPEGIVLLAE
jgi:hypothetical protein